MPSEPTNEETKVRNALLVAHREQIGFQDAVLEYTQAVYRRALEDVMAMVERLRKANEDNTAYTDEDFYRKQGAEGAYEDVVNDLKVGLA